MDALVRSREAADKIRETLVREGISMRELAVALEMPDRSLACQLSGYAPITLEFLADVSACLGVEIIELMPRTQRRGAELTS